MLRLDLNIHNPFSDESFNNCLWCNSVNISKFKVLELQIDSFNLSDIFTFTFCVETKCDHAGIRNSFSILGLGYHIMFYDNRHWDYDNDRFMTYDEMKNAED